MKYLSFEFMGKATRKEFFKTLLFAFLILFFYGLLASILFPTVDINSFKSAMDYNGPSSFALGAIMVVGWILNLIGFLVVLTVCIRRCSDIGINPNWLWVLYLFPLCVSIVGVSLGVKYGTDNREFLVGLCRIFQFLGIVLLGCLPGKTETVTNKFIKTEPTL